MSVKPQPHPQQNHLLAALSPEVQARLFRLHGLLRQIAGVDATQGDLGFLVALGAGGHQFPAGQALGQSRQGLVAAFGHRALPVGVLRHPGLGQAAGHPLRQFVNQQLARALFGVGQRGRQASGGGVQGGQIGQVNYAAAKSGIMHSKL